MKVLVTGCSGFIGSRTVEFLDGVGGIDVRGVSRHDFGKAGFYCLPQLTTEGLKHLFSELDWCPQVILHAIGTGSVGVAQESPLISLDGTVQSLAHVLEWIRTESPLTKLIYFSSAAVYGSTNKIGGSESSVRSPQSVYGYHKCMAEDMIEMYQSQFGLNAIIFRIFSAYGEGLKKQILWDVCSRISKSDYGKNMQFMGTGEEIRDWMHVDDIVKSICFGISSTSFDGHTVNVGTGRSHSVNDLVSLILEVWFSGSDASPPKPCFDKGVRLGDPHCLLADVKLLESVVSFDLVSLRDGVHRYVNWFKSYEKKN